MSRWMIRRSITPRAAAARISSRRRDGRSGSDLISTPSGASASATALATAPPAATMPSSPAPLTPRGLVGEGSSSRTHSSSGGMSTAAGRWYSISVPAAS